MPHTRFRLLLFVLLALSSTFATGQSNHSNEELKNMTFGQRLYYGGMLGASFGTINSVQVMPVIGYRIMHRWSAGVGITYQYYQDTRPPSYDTHIYGGNVHTRVYIWDQIFGHSEFEVLSMEVLDLTLQDYEITRRNIPAWFIGAGYFMPIGKRSGLGITFLYDVIQDHQSPYPQHYVLRLGFVL